MKRGTLFCINYFILRVTSKEIGYLCWNEGFCNISMSLDTVPNSKFLSVILEPEPGQYSYYFMLKLIILIKLCRWFSNHNFSLTSSLLGANEVLLKYFRVFIVFFKSTHEASPKFKTKIGGLYANFGATVFVSWPFCLQSATYR